MNRKYYEETLRDKKYHALTYVPNTMRIEKHHTVCEWLCDCGTTITARAQYVIKGRLQSCKCYVFRTRENNSQWRGVGDMPGAYWSNFRASARYRKIKLRITQKEAWGLFLKQERKCALTGVTLTFDTRRERRDGSASLDRIDSSKPYVKENIQWVHKDLNNMKKGLPQDRFIEWCHKVSAYQNI